MEKIILEYKKPGETPLDCINRLKNMDKSYTHVPMTYAGRLDPMAEGLMLILVGDECQKKDEYTALEKEYEVDVLFGFATDTYDLLGVVNGSLGILPQRTHEFSAENSLHVRTVALSSSSGTTFTRELESELEKFAGKILQKYPPYSSRTVSGKPLFQWAREGRLDEIEIPTHEVFVKKIEVKKVYEISGKKLLKSIKEGIAKVSGDFRQEEILKRWEEVLGETPSGITATSPFAKGREFPVVKLVISCSSGTYVRAIAHELGEKLGTQALAMHILRTKIGDYKIQK